MTIAVQLKDVRESIYQWVSEERRWTPGQTCLGELLYDRFFLRVQTLVQMLTKEGFAENAADVNGHWKSAIAELNSDLLRQMLDSSYANTIVSPYDACWDCWPEEGPARLERFLHSLGGLLISFAISPAKTEFSDFKSIKDWKHLLWPDKTTEARKKAWQRFKRQLSPSDLKEHPSNRCVAISKSLLEHLSVSTVTVREQ